MKSTWKARLIGLAVSVLIIGGLSMGYAQTGQDILTRLSRIELALWGGPNVSGATTITGASTGSQTGTVTTAAVITSTLGSGAPIVVTSTAPATHLNAYAVAYNAAGTQQATGHVVFGTCTLGTNCAVTLAGAAAYTGAATYYCSATDQTAAAAVKIVNTSASVVTLTGTGTDVLGYVCFGT